MDDTDRRQRIIFVGCFLAMLATSFAFVTRAYLIGAPSLWPAEFGLDKVKAQELFMAGVWPFAIAIIACGLLTDKIGYRVAMYASAVCFAVYIVAAVAAQMLITLRIGDEDARHTAYTLLYWSSVALGVGSGMVEGFINPVIATLFRTEKTKWLNRLHAGWPAGFVLGGLLTILLTGLAQRNWLVLIVLLALPVTAYVWVLMGVKFPVHERVAAGSSYRGMLAEFGVLGWGLVSFLVLKQLALVPGIAMPDLVAVLIWAALVAVYAQFSRSWGRPMLLLLSVLMMLLAIGEIGTDGSITGILEARLTAAGKHPLWVLIFIGLVMFVMRMSAGFIVKRCSPIVLLCICAGGAALGLWWLSDADSLATILMAAGLYAAANAYLWPTTLGVAAERHPKGGALTLTALSGVGMLAAGIVGGPLIGAIQENVARKAIERRMPGIYQTISHQDRYVLGDYSAVDPDKVRLLARNKQDDLAKIVRRAKQKALTRMAVFPALLCCGYLGMYYYFRRRGGYKPIDIHGAKRVAEVELGL